MQDKRNAMLMRTIAAFKFLKAVALVLAGIGVLRLINKDTGEFAESLVFRLHLSPGNHFVGEALARVANVTPKQLHELGVVSFIYAGLFLLEGIGLWSLKRWGEWVTVVITSSLLPVEIYELFRRPTLVRAALLLFNAAVVWYLVNSLRRGEVK